MDIPSIVHGRHLSAGDVLAGKKLGFVHEDESIDQSVAESGNVVLAVWQAFVHASLRGWG